MTGNEGRYHDPHDVTAPQARRTVNTHRSPEEPIRLADLSPEVVGWLHGVLQGLRTTTITDQVGGLVRAVALQRLLHGPSEVSRISLKTDIDALNAALKLGMDGSVVDDMVTQAWSELQHWSTGGVGDPTDDSPPPQPQPEA